MRISENIDSNKTCGTMNARLTLCVREFVWECSFTLHTPDIQQHNEPNERASKRLSFFVHAAEVAAFG